MFLDLLDYRMVVVPKNAKVTISCETQNGERIYGAGAPKNDETVQIFAESTNGDIVVDEVNAQDEPLVVRCARQDKPDRKNTRFPNVQKSIAKKAADEASNAEE